MSVTPAEAREIIRWGNRNRRMLRENYRRQFVAYSATQFLAAGTDYHQVKEDRFAEEDAQRFNTLLKDDVPGILVAAPRTLGVMRRHLGAETRSRLIAEIDKDYAQRPVAEIETMLERYEI